MQFKIYFTNAFAVTQMCQLSKFSNLVFRTLQLSNIGILVQLQTSEK